MHRHGYKGRKFGRERDQRNALITGLMKSLVEHQSIKTTLPKAKELRRPMEKVITMAKKGDLANRRRVIAKLGNDVKLGNMLVDVIAPQISRNSGYLRVVRLDEWRVGDHAEMAKIEFVDEINVDVSDSHPAHSTESNIAGSKDESLDSATPAKADAQNDKPAKKSETTVTKKTAPKAPKGDK